MVAATAVAPVVDRNHRRRIRRRNSSSSSSSIIEADPVKLVSSSTSTSSSMARMMVEAAEAKGGRPVSSPLGLAYREEEEEEEYEDGDDCQRLRRPLSTTSTSLSLSSSASTSTSTPPPCFGGTFLPTVMATLSTLLAVTGATSSGSNSYSTSSSSSFLVIPQEDFDDDDDDDDNDDCHDIDEEDPSSTQPRNGPQLGRRQPQRGGATIRWEEEEEVFHAAAMDDGFCNDDNKVEDDKNASSVTAFSSNAGPAMVPASETDGAMSSQQQQQPPTSPQQIQETSTPELSLSEENQPTESKGDDGNNDNYDEEQSTTTTATTTTTPSTVANMTPAAALFEKMFLEQEEKRYQEWEQSHRNEEENDETVETSTFVRPTISLSSSTSSTHRRRRRRRVFDLYETHSTKLVPQSRFLQEQQQQQKQEQDQESTSTGITTLPPPPNADEVAGNVLVIPDGGGRRRHRNGKCYHHERRQHNPYGSPQERSCVPFRKCSRPDCACSVRSTSGRATGCHYQQQVPSLERNKEHEVLGHASTMVSSSSSISSSWRVASPSTKTKARKHGPKTKTNSPSSSNKSVCTTTTEVTMASTASASACSGMDHHSFQRSPLSPMPAITSSSSPSRVWSRGHEKQQQPPSQLHMASTVHGDNRIASLVQSTDATESVIAATPCETGRNVAIVDTAVGSSSSCRKPESEQDLVGLWIYEPNQQQSDEKPASSWQQQQKQQQQQPTVPSIYRGGTKQRPRSEDYVDGKYATKHLVVSTPPLSPPSASSSFKASCDNNKNSINNPVATAPFSYSSRSDRYQNRQLDSCNFHPRQLFVKSHSEPSRLSYTDHNMGTIVGDGGRQQPQRSGPINPQASLSRSSTGPNSRNRAQSQDYSRRPTGTSTSGSHPMSPCITPPFQPLCKPRCRSEDVVMDGNIIQRMPSTPRSRQTGGEGDKSTSATRRCDTPKTRHAHSPTSVLQVKTATETTGTTIESSCSQTQRRDGQAGRRSRCRTRLPSASCNSPARDALERELDEYRNTARLIKKRRQQCCHHPVSDGGHDQGRNKIQTNNVALQLATVYHEMGQLHYRLCRYSTALLVLEHAVDVVTQTVRDPSRPRLVLTLNEAVPLLSSSALRLVAELVTTQAKVQLAQGRPSQAKLSLRYVLDWYVIGAQHQQYPCQETDVVRKSIMAAKWALTRCRAQVLLAQVSQQEHHPDVAIRHFQEAVGVQKLILGGNHVVVADTVHQIGNLHLSQGYLNLAAQCYHEALSIYQWHCHNGSTRKNMYGIMDSCSSAVVADGAVTLASLGWIHLLHRDYREALQCTNQALQWTLQALGPMHRNVASMQYQLGWIHWLGSCNNLHCHPSKMGLSIWKKVLIHQQHVFLPSSPSSMIDLTPLYQNSRHLDLAKTLQAMGLAYQACGGSVKAANMFHLAAEIVHQNLSTND